jgi:hypothetical protein
MDRIDASRRTGDGIDHQRQIPKHNRRIFFRAGSKAIFPARGPEIFRWPDLPGPPKGASKFFF